MKIEQEKLYLITEKLLNRWDENILEQQNILMEIISNLEIVELNEISLILRKLEINLQRFIQDE
jgi:hypothetical protein